MSRSNPKNDCVAAKDAQPGILPAGTPDWITAELIEQTIRTWQPYYATNITIEDAIEMIHNVGRLFNALSTGK